MNDYKKSIVAGQSSYNSLYINPHTDMNGSNRECSDKDNTSSINDKENVFSEKENVPFPSNGLSSVPKRNPDKLKSFSVKGSSNVAKRVSSFKSMSTGRILKETSLQVCMQMSEPDKAFGSKLWETFQSENSSGSVNIWDYSDSEAAPASSWSTLPNRTLLCRTLPLDVGRCTCVIVKEPLPEGLNGGTLQSLYTNEGQGRKNRKLAIAYHKRRNGKSEFTVAQNIKGILSTSDNNYIGMMTSNLMGTKYHILDQGTGIRSLSKQSNQAISVVTFMPTITTWTGSYRCMKAFIPKNQSINSSHMQHINGVSNERERKMEKVHHLKSRIPHYSSISKQYELDFRDKGRSGLKIESSVKNFQLTLEENGRQTILQLGRVSKSKYVMDFRYPLTGYQAFCMCLASIDSKLCCAL